MVFSAGIKPHTGAGICGSELLTRGNVSEWVIGVLNAVNEGDDWEFVYAFLKYATCTIISLKKLQHYKKN